MTIRGDFNMSDRQKTLDAFDNKRTDTLPVGFWFHFLPFSGFAKGPENPALFQKMVEDQKKYYREVKPDLVKIMTDGYFVLPTLRDIDPLNPKALLTLAPADPRSPWFDEQVEMARRIVEETAGEAVVIYNLFAPIFHLFFRGEGQGPPRIDKDAATLVQTASEALRYALSVISDDLATLGERVLSEAKADGVFLSVRNYEGVSKSDYLDLIAPGERDILRRAAKIRDYSVLHICGEPGVPNDFSAYVDYEAKAFHWAVTKSDLSLKDGKALFGGRAVMGGLDNTAEGVLYKGDRAAIEDAVERLVREADEPGVLIGADCTLPNEISYEHLKWAVQKARSL
jgi:uroporphyrinogen decarboxylase